MRHTKYHRIIQCFKVFGSIACERESFWLLIDRCRSWSSSYHFKYKAQPKSIATSLFSSRLVSFKNKKLTRTKHKQVSCQSIFYSQLLNIYKLLVLFRKNTRPPFICNKFYSLSINFCFFVFLLHSTACQWYRQRWWWRQRCQQQQSITKWLFSIQLRALSGQFIGPFVASYTLVRRHILPPDLQLWIAFNNSIQFAKIGFIFHRTAAAQPPIAFFPIFHPFGHRPDDKMWIGIDAQLFNVGIDGQCNGFDDRLNFATIICCRPIHRCRCVPVE